MVFMFVISFLVCLPSCWCAREAPPRVGIVGGGIGGSSSAYFISRELPGANITVFEKERLGGRLATVTVGGREYETGGSIIHPANKGRNI